MNEPSPFSEPLQKARELGRERRLITLERSRGKFIEYRGRTLLHGASNNYLDLAHHRRLAEAAAQAAYADGVGSGGARLLGGTSTWHTELEARMQGYRPLGACLLFNTGFTANLGLVATLAPVLGTVFSDHENHASTTDALIGLDAGRRAAAKRSFQRYRHLDMTHLERLITADAGRSDARPGLVVSETVFSMNGDIAPLADLFALQKRHGFWLLLDEAHSTLCLPDLLEPHLAEARDRGRTLVMGTFGKAFGSFGAYACGPREAIDFLIQFCRPFLFSTSLPPPILAASMAALEIASAEPERAVKLAAVAKTLRERLVAEGFELAGSASHIVPVLFGSEARALAASRVLDQAQIHAPAIRPPTVAAGKSRLRLSITSAFDSDDVHTLATALIRARAATESV